MVEAGNRSIAFITQRVSSPTIIDQQKKATFPCIGIDSKGKGVKNTLCVTGALKQEKERERERPRDRDPYQPVILIVFAQQTAHRTRTKVLSVLFIKLLASYGSRSRSIRHIWKVLSINLSKKQQNPLSIALSWCRILQRQTAKKRPSISKQCRRTKKQTKKCS